MQPALDEGIELHVIHLAGNEERLCAVATSQRVGAQLRLAAALSLACARLWKITDAYLKRLPGCTLWSSLF